MIEVSDEFAEELMAEAPAVDTGPGEWVWRVGTSYDIHVYALHPTAARDEKGRSEHDVPIFSTLGDFATARVLASQMVFEHNRALRQNDESRFEALTAVTEEELRLAAEQEFDSADGPFTTQIQQDVREHEKEGD